MIIQEKACKFIKEKKKLLIINNIFMKANSKSNIKVEKILKKNHRFLNI